MLPKNDAELHELNRRAMRDTLTLIALVTAILLLFLGARAVF